MKENISPEEEEGKSRQPLAGSRTGGDGERPGLAVHLVGGRRHWRGYNSPGGKRVDELSRRFSRKQRGK